MASGIVDAIDAVARTCVRKKADGMTDCAEAKSVTPESRAWWVVAQALGIWAWQPGARRWAAMVVAGAGGPALDESRGPVGPSDPPAAGPKGRHGWRP